MTRPGEHAEPAGPAEQNSWGDPLGDQAADVSAPQDPRLTAVLEQVAGLDGRPLPEHAEVYEDARAGLQAVLDEPLLPPTAGEPRAAGGSDA